MVSRIPLGSSNLFVISNINLYSNEFPYGVYGQRVCVSIHEGPINIGSMTLWTLEP